MPRIEIEQKVGHSKRNLVLNKDGRLDLSEPYWKTEKTNIDVPADDEGSYQTGMGQISVRHIKRDLYGNIREIELTGDVMRGTPPKDRHKRTVSKRISLNQMGCGIQTLSKIENIHVILWNSRAHELNPQMCLSLGGRAEPYKELNIDDLLNGRNQWGIAVIPEAAIEGYLSRTETPKVRRYDINQGTGNPI